MMCLAPAAMEEFHGADVLWPEHHQQQIKGRKTQVGAARGGEVHRPCTSAPVAIPVAVRSSEPASSSWAGSHDNPDGGDEAAFVPPHMLVARRWSSEEKAASSMCVGQGRTLKGRDLQCVRTAVLRMTGFIEN